MKSAITKGTGFTEQSTGKDFSKLPTFDGVLKKRAKGGRGRWQKRYFITNNWFLNYFNNEKAAQDTNKIKCSIDLTKFSGAEAVGFRGVFELRFPTGEAYVLQAKTGEDASRWIDNLRERMCRFAEPQSRRPPGRRESWIQPGASSPVASDPRLAALREEFAQEEAGDGATRNGHDDDTLDGSGHDAKRRGSHRPSPISDAAGARRKPSRTGANGGGRTLAGAIVQTVSVESESEAAADGNHTDGGANAGMAAARRRKGSDRRTSGVKGKLAQYAGRLKKRTTSKLKKWKSLYARLYPSVLCLFDDEITDEPRFTIPLTTIREISSLDNGRDLKSKNDIILRMGIGAGNVFRAESAQDAEKWIRQLRKTVLAAKTAPSRTSMQLATTAEADYSSGSDSDDSHTATMPAWLRELKAGDLAEQMEAVNTRAMSYFSGAPLGPVELADAVLALCQDLDERAAECRYRDERALLKLHVRMYHSNTIFHITNLTNEFKASHLSPHDILRVLDCITTYGRARRQALAGVHVTPEDGIPPVSLEAPMDTVLERYRLSLRRKAEPYVKQALDQLDTEVEACFRPGVTAETEPSPYIRQRSEKPGSMAPNLLFKVLHAHVEAAKSDGSVKLRRSLLAELMGHIVAFGSQVFARLAGAWAELEAKLGPPLAVSCNRLKSQRFFLLAMVNDVGACLRHVNALEQEFHVMLQQEKQEIQMYLDMEGHGRRGSRHNSVASSAMRTEFQEVLHDSAEGDDPTGESDDLKRARLALHKIVAGLLGVIAQTMEYEWRPAARQLFTGNWEQQTHMNAIANTLEESFYEIRPWFEYEHDVVPKLAGMLLSKVVHAFLKHLFEVPKQTAKKFTSFFGRLRAGPSGLMTETQARQVYVDVGQIESLIAADLGNEERQTIVAMAGDVRDMLLSDAPSIVFLKAVSNYGRFAAHLYIGYEAILEMRPDYTNSRREEERAQAIEAITSFGQPPSDDWMCSDENDSGWDPRTEVYRMLHDIFPEASERADELFQHQRTQQPESPTTPEPRSTLNPTRSNGWVATPATADDDLPAPVSLMDFLGDDTGEVHAAATPPPSQGAPGNPFESPSKAGNPFAGGRSQSVTNPAHSAVVSTARHGSVDNVPPRGQAIQVSPKPQAAAQAAPQPLSLGTVSMAKLLAREQARKKGSTFGKQKQRRNIHDDLLT